MGALLGSGLTEREAIRTFEVREPQWLTMGPWEAREAREMGFHVGIRGIAGGQPYGMTTPYGKTAQVGRTVAPFGKAAHLGTVAPYGWETAMPYATMPVTTGATYQPTTVVLY
jgi:hypothetical protein